MRPALPILCLGLALGISGAIALGFIAPIPGAVAILAAFLVGAIINDDLDPPSYA